VLSKAKHQLSPNYLRPFQEAKKEFRGGIFPILFRLYPSRGTVVCVIPNLC